MKKKGETIKNIKNPSRRSFIKKAIAGGIVVASGAVIAKTAVSLASKDAANNANLNDEIKQDIIMMQKKYVLMTKQEKEQMLKTLADSYKGQSSQS